MGSKTLTTCRNGKYYLRKFQQWKNLLRTKYSSGHEVNISNSIPEDGIYTKAMIQKKNDGKCDNDYSLILSNAEEEKVIVSYEPGRKDPLTPDIKISKIIQEGEIVDYFDLAQPCKLSEISTYLAEIDRSQLQSGFELCCQFENQFRRVRFFVPTIVLILYIAKSCLGIKLYHVTRLFFFFWIPVVISGLLVNAFCSYSDLTRSYRMLRKIFLPITLFLEYTFTYNVNVVIKIFSKLKQKFQKKKKETEVEAAKTDEDEKKPKPTNGFPRFIIAPFVLYLFFCCMFHSFKGITAGIVFIVPAFLCSTIYKKIEKKIMMRVNNICSKVKKVYDRFSKVMKIVYIIGLLILGIDLIFFLGNSFGPGFLLFCIASPIFVIGDLVDFITKSYFVQRYSSNSPVVVYVILVISGYLLFFPFIKYFVLFVFGKRGKRISLKGLGKLFLMFYFICTVIVCLAVVNNGIWEKRCYIPSNFKKDFCKPVGAFGSVLTKEFVYILKY